MSDSSNPDETNGNSQKENTRDKTDSKEDIYQRLRKFSTLDGGTILQVDATAMVGVLFFLSLTSLLGIQEGQGRINAVFLTIIAVFPFSGSAIFVLWAYELQSETLSHFIHKEKLQPTKEKDYRKIAKALKGAVYFTGIGFGYLLVILGIFGTVAGTFALSNQDMSQECGKDPERFGVNESNIWQCSMFSENALAKQCASDPSKFNRSLSECHEFIPPSE